MNEAYKAKRLNSLRKEILKIYGGEIDPGIWRGKKGNSYKSHILPLKGNINTPKTRMEAIIKYTGLDPKVLSDFLKTNNTHQYAHHINSSQLLGLSIFGNMVNNDGSPKQELIDLMKHFRIEISNLAKCVFEYQDDMMWEQKNEKEGTSFDFFIVEGNKRYFFEFKFTEDGFGKAKNDNRHKEKIKDVYSTKIEKSTILKTPIGEDQVMKNYQLYRNLIRRETDNDTIIFITDKENPQTEKELDNFFKNYITNEIGIKRITWQEIKKIYPSSCRIPFQLNAL